MHTTAQLSQSGTRNGRGGLCIWEPARNTGRKRQCPVCLAKKDYLHRENLLLPTPSSRPSRSLRGVKIAVKVGDQISANPPAAAYYAMAYPNQPGTQRGGSVIRRMTSEDILTNYTFGLPKAR
ncbi:uncharacterized protein NECHADRAFT_83414 [Fusarium vanettenii 77-13-4]|uniref:Uncharacterized protein n=1 Tax=Fusarium vanettenii (strain ATCC MYA-4622 / CBS 123669 / FGSC 9596 / NRRL 45880 / 77-13-4) TaxID=660122 RepID=C7Z3Y6_FUSV7|nr:uncharacterized protein NECHADRAFT_83414 [Fusarium vanettenii 77-13-4]EEU41385.1 predicted protein [Fusarium vanettenii 77-13-4]